MEDTAESVPEEKNGKGNSASTKMETFPWASPNEKMPN